VTAKTASERKKIFDKLMRNRGRKERPDQPERSPCVLYLGEEARHELTRNRELDRAVGVKPLADSEFVERAILRLPRGHARELAVSESGKQIAKARKSIESLVRNQHRHESELAIYQLRIDKLRSQLANKGVEAQHKAGLNPRFMRLHQSIRRELSVGRTQLAEAKAVHDLIADYLAYLCR